MPENTEFDWESEDEAARKEPYYVPPEDRVEPDLDLEDSPLVVIEFENTALQGGDDADPDEIARHRKGGDLYGEVITEDLV